MATSPLSAGRPVSTPAKIAAGTLAALVLVGIGVVVGRATSSPSDSGASTSPTTDTSAGEVHAGPAEIRAGVPVGYARTRAGAVAAAANLAVVLDGPVVLDPERRGAVLDVVAAGTARDNLAGRFRDMGELLGDRLGLGGAALQDPGLAMRTVPAGYRVEEYSDDAATVDVWGTSVFVSDGRSPIPSGWGTTQVSLVWEHGDWRVTNLATSDGPSPPTTGEAAVTTSVGRQINQFVPFWFTPPRGR